MNPSPTPIDVTLRSNAAEWWDIVGALGPFAVLTAALLATAIGWYSLRQRTTADKLALEQKNGADDKALLQKQHADDRSEWWRRAQWALDRALDSDRDTKSLGMATLEVLAKSKLAHEEELELFDITWEAVSAVHIASEPFEGGDENGYEFAFVEPTEPDERFWPRFSGTSRPRSISGRKLRQRRPPAVDSHPRTGDNEETVNLGTEES